MKVRVDDEYIFTVYHATNNAFGGEPGVLYYEFIERPGELFKAARCKVIEPEYEPYQPLIGGSI